MALKEVKVMKYFIAIITTQIQTSVSKRQKDLSTKKSFCDTV